MGLGEDFADVSRDLVFEGAKHPFKLNLVHIDGRPVGYREGEAAQVQQIQGVLGGHDTVGIEAQIPATVGT